MQFQLAVLSALASAVAASGTIYVDNFCGYTTYLQSTADGQSSSGLKTLPANTQNAYNELERAAGTTNAAITISRNPDLSSPVQFVYNPQTTTDYYSLSTKFGDPFKADGFEALSSGGGYNIICPPRADGAGDCPNTYSPSNPDGNGAVFQQDPNGNFIIRLCASSG